MAVGLEDVRQVAALARLEFSPEEEGRLVGELNRILEYMEKLGELDTERIEPTSHPVPIAHALAPDAVEARSASGDLVSSAPQVQGGYFKVPRIID